MVRGGGVDDFFTYRYAYFEGEGVFYEIVTLLQISTLRNQRALSSIFSALWNQQKKSIN